MKRASGRLSKQREIALLPEDADEFSDILRAKFPDVRFLHYNYWRGYSDDSGHVQRPPSLVVPYYDSLGDPGERWFLVWLEPEGWKPIWTGPNEYDIYVIANEPRLQVSFDRGGIPRLDPTWFAESRMWVIYERDDKEHLRFINQVWRLIDKFCERALIKVDPRTGETRGEPIRGGLRYGPRLVEWFREDPRRHFRQNWRPAAACE